MNPISIGGDDGPQLTFPAAFVLHIRIGRPTDRPDNWLTVSCVLKWVNEKAA